MFRTAELGHKVTKQDYKQRESVLRQQLLEVQRKMNQLGRFSVIVVFAGVDGAGKAQTVNLLNEWMDPRWLVTRAYGEASEEERERPEFWRYWRDLPPRGRIGLFLRSWYSRPILGRVYGHLTCAELDKRLDRIIAFEKALADDGAIILKFWMHLSREAQRKRLKSLEKDPLTRWQIKDTSWEHWRMYDKFLEIAEQTILRTSTGQAPFTLVEGADAYYRSLKVGNVLLDSIVKAIKRVKVEDKLKANLRIDPIVKQRPVVKKNSSSTATTDDPKTNTEQITILSHLDMSQSIEKSAYNLKLKKYQGRLNLLQRKAKEQGVSTLLVFEGWDAAGKGGTIRRITAALDASNYQVFPFAAPNDEERVHHYLWRFWRHLSRAGRFTIYDRSWYGRVLVERVEGYASETELRRAYKEINDFETQLIEHGIVLQKYWLHITKEQQLARFKEREQIPHKRWKLTGEDWRNRDKWEDYELAVNDMIQRTSTRLAPWILVESNDKRFARIKVLKTLCKKLEKALGGD